MLTSTVNISPPSSTNPTVDTTFAIAIVRSKANKTTVHVDSKHDPPQMVNIAFLRLRVTPLRCSFKFKFWRLNLICLINLSRRRLFLVSDAAGGSSPPISASIGTGSVGFPSSTAAVDDDTTAADKCLGRKNMVRRLLPKNMMCRLYSGLCGWIGGTVVCWLTDDVVPTNHTPSSSSTRAVMFLFLSVSLD